ncbi:hypothetical protein FLJC2902T_01970 [Flavobacterium limnosediminis JC2902]|uniref:Secretion system C-terminal sorting domain-containing protein n=1 Tax=Flavobacterium limnosediminis JC2902 TaxID=1341181 RepID=V6SSQ1_9FLAO|nr:T9SS type A sorting domain-containing protein [Flavobacterium limnosediminis]ESU29723.1 hypothetical protein FLJC2902T_01970 [Flavobacterium limnosediminis JC2902]
MKQIYTLLLTLVVSTLSFGQTFYSENMGVPTGTTAIAAYAAQTAPATFQNSTPIVYSGTGTARATSSSSYTGASGGGNIFLTVTSSVGNFFQIDGLNTSSHNAADIQLSFGYLTNATSTHLVVEQSTNGGTNWTPITYTQNTTTSWNLVTVTGGQIPSSATLSLRFTNPSTTSAQMRLDDVKLTNVSSSCSLAPGTPTAVCDANTLTLDTYTATIPYVGAGNATYTINTSTGTVGGDNPTSVAAGNIIINGIPEDTDITVTITGGTCNIVVPITSPHCITANSLPYNESFNYTPATVLSSTQMWSPFSTGDDIVVTSGNLSYPGITSSGNSVTFIGTGRDARTPLTTVSTGTIYASFIVNITDVSTVVNDLTDVTYFALFDQSTSNFTDARLWHRRNGTQSQFGVSTSNTTASVIWSPNLHTPGTPVYLSFGYDFATQIVTLTENPTIGGSAVPSVYATLAAPISSIGGFALRQDSTNATPNLIIDELRIATTPNFTLSTTSFDNILGLNIYPNPTNDILHIATTANSVKTIAIYDVVGKQVLNTTTSNEVINVSSLNKGVYMVKITEEGKTATRKLVVK